MVAVAGVTATYASTEGGSSSAVGGVTTVYASTEGGSSRAIAGAARSLTAADDGVAPSSFCVTPRTHPTLVLGWIVAIVPS